MWVRSWTEIPTPSWVARLLPIPLQPAFLCSLGSVQFGVRQSQREETKSNQANHLVNLSHVDAL